MIPLTKYLACRLGPRGVRTNGISSAGLYSGQPEAFVKHYCPKAPLGRTASHDDIKGIVVFLASDGYNQFVNAFSAPV